MATINQNAPRFDPVSAPTLIQIDFTPGDGYYVRCVMPNGEIEEDIHFWDDSKPSKAEVRAKELCRIYGCTWEANY